MAQPLIVQGATVCLEKVFCIIGTTTINNVVAELTVPSGLDIDSYELRSKHGHLIASSRSGPTITIPVLPNGVNRLEVCFEVVDEVALCDSSRIIHLHAHEQANLEQDLTNNDADRELKGVYCCDLSACVVKTPIDYEDLENEVANRDLECANINE